MRMRFGPDGVDFGPFVRMSMGRRGFGSGFGGGFGGDWDFGPGGFGWGGGRGGGSRRRRRRMFDPGELRLVLLKLIGDEPRHGYDLIRAVEEMTGGEYAPSPGVVYPTLSLLEDSGLIEQVESDGARKLFRLTSDGRDELDERMDEIDRLFERLEDAGEARTAGGPQIGRAVGNLLAALGHRIGGAPQDEELRHRIAAVLDEAAQKIERL